MINNLLLIITLIYCEFLLPFYRGREQSVELLSDMPGHCSMAGGAINVGGSPVLF